MPEEQVHRRLAAILAGDIAGYSRLMSADEEGTLRDLKGHRKARHQPCWFANYAPSWDVLSVM